MNKSLVTFGTISFLIIFLFGFNFLLSLLGNILILLFLTPILLIIVAIIGISSFKSRVKVCTNCGLTMIKEGENCSYCGANFSVIEKNKDYSEDPGSETIEIEAEEIN